MAEGFTTMAISTNNRARLSFYRNAGDTMNDALDRVLNALETYQRDVAENATTEDELGFA